jgi:hypothetical protein
MLGRANRRVRPPSSASPRATVAKRLSAVRSLDGYLVDRGAIDASPAVGVKVPRTPREPRWHAITQEHQVARPNRGTAASSTDNHASRAAHRAAGFQEVGIQPRHGKLEGHWKDCALVERVLGPAAS